MKRKITIFLISLILLSLLSSCELFTERADDITVYALFVGLDYADEAGFDSLNTLDGTIRDAKEMAAASASLYSYYGIGFEGYLSIQSQEDATDEEDALYPSKEKILQRIAAIKERMDDNDIFIFYFAGHGIEDETERGYLIVASDDDSVEYETLGVGYLSSALNSLPGNSVVILDSCYSGEHVSPYPLYSDNVVETFNPHTFSLVASKDDQTSIELELDNGETHGYFTLAFLHSLGWVHTETTTANLYYGDNSSDKRAYSVTGHIEKHEGEMITLEDIADSIRNKEVNSLYDVSWFISQNYQLSSGPTGIILFTERW